jgi:hypothetical protein
MNNNALNEEKTRIKIEIDHNSDPPCEPSDDNGEIRDGEFGYEKGRLERILGIT